VFFRLRPRPAAVAQPVRRPEVPELRLARALFYGGCLLLGQATFRYAGRLTLSEAMFIASLAFSVLAMLRGEQPIGLPSPIVAAAGVTYLLNVDVVLSKHFLSGHDSGLYAAGAVLGRVIYFLGMTGAAVMFPEVTRRHARGEAHFAVVEKSLALLGILSVVYSTSTNTTLQLSSGEAYRGRILSVYTLLFMGTTPIGGAITGVLADRWGITTTLAIEASVCLLATLLGTLYLRSMGVSTRDEDTLSPIREVVV